MDKKKLKVLVCGCGSIGMRHMANLVALKTNVLCWKPGNYSTYQQEFINNNNIRVTKNVDDGINRANAVVIASPADSHIEIALNCLAKKKAIYIEKPLSNGLKNIESIKQMAEGNTIEIGCQLRSHHALKKLCSIIHGSGNIGYYRFSMGHRIDKWRPGQDYTKLASVSSIKGGGALFELVHMIDLAIWFFGPINQVSAFQDKRSKFRITCDDITVINIKHKDGTLGQIQLDMLSPKYHCDIEVVSLEAVYKIDITKGVLSKETDDGSEIVCNKDESVSRNELFLRQMGHFIERLSGHEVEALCPLQDGIESLEALIAMTSSAELSQVIRVKDHTSGMTGLCK